MRIIIKGSDTQPIENMDNLTFICSCGCQFEASIQEKEAKLRSLSPFPTFATFPTLFVYTSTCPSCGAPCIYQGEPINYCCCSTDEEVEKLKEDLKRTESSRCSVPAYLSVNP